MPRMDLLRSFVPRVVLVATVLLSIDIAILGSSVSAQSDSSTQLLLFEAQTVHQTNLARREQGLAPLRWNQELTAAARWFSQDSVEHRATNGCDHVDSLGRSTGARIAAFGYPSAGGWGENVVCGLTSPTAAVNGWLNSAEHREQLLNPTFREIGIGYYHDAASGLGFISQELGVDPAFAPVIIENEALATTTADVALYIYSPLGASGFVGMTGAYEMMIANEPTFANADWEPYTAEKMWRLPPGEGWRTVYVKLRDRLGRVLTAQDTIYLGAAVPQDELSLAHATSIRSALAIDELDDTNWPLVQFRMNWMADDSDSSLQVVSGTGMQQSDGQALGGTTYRLPAGQETAVMLRTHRFFHNTPMEAFVRLKVHDNRSTKEIARLSINGGGVTYGPLVVRGVDFATTDEYQAFMLPFVFHESRENPFMEFTLHTSGDVEIQLDAVTFYSAPVPLASSVQWSVPGSYYRGQGVWARYSDGNGRFSNAMALGSRHGNATMTMLDENLIADDLSLILATSAQDIRATATADDGALTIATVEVDCAECGDVTWVAECAAPWIELEQSAQALIVKANPANMAPSTYADTITLTVPDRPDIQPAQIAVALVVEAAPTPVGQTAPPATVPPVPEAAPSLTAQGHHLFLPFTVTR